jgi:hypothetical protein
MFAVVLKNSILLFFTLCIGYFIVDNHLSELAIEARSGPVKTGLKSSKMVQIDEMENQVPLLNKKYISQLGDLPYTKVVVEMNDNPLKEKIDPDLKDMYNYVFNDVKAIDDLDMIYANNEVKDVHKDRQILCENDSIEEEKIKRMCNEPILDHHENISYEDIEIKGVTNQSMYDFVDKHI